MKKTFISHFEKTYGKVMVTLLLVLATSCAVDAKPRKPLNPHQFYLVNILNPCVKQPYRTFTVTKTNADFPMFDMKYRIVRTPEAVALLTDNEATLYTDSEMLQVNYLTHELIRCPKDADVVWGYSYEWRRTQYLNSVTEWYNPLVYQQRLIDKRYLDVRFTRGYDTVLDGVAYKVLEWDDTTRHVYLESSDERLPFYFTIAYYYDMERQALRRIVGSPMEVPNNHAKPYGTTRLDIDITYENPTSMLETLFDFNRSTYRNYTRHNNTDSLPVSWYYRSASQNTEVTDTLLNHPIVSVNGDTVTLRSLQGWVLMDLWFTGCKPCYEQMQRLGSNADGHGLEWLQQQGLTVMLLHPYAGDGAAVRRDVQRYGVEDVTYHSKGLATLLNVKRMPVWLLLSPDKKQLRFMKTLDDLPALLAGQQ